MDKALERLQMTSFMTIEDWLRIVLFKINPLLHVLKHPKCVSQKKSTVLFVIYRKGHGFLLV